MKDARHVPDVSKMLRDGLPYLTEIEATEVQLALAVSIYAHSKPTATGSDTSSSADGHPDDRVKVRPPRTLVGWLTILLLFIGENHNDF